MPGTSDRSPIKRNRNRTKIEIQTRHTVTKSSTSFRAQLRHRLTPDKITHLNINGVFPHRWQGLDLCRRLRRGSGDFPGATTRSCAMVERGRSRIRYENRGEIFT